MKILIVEDEKDLAQSLANGLRLKGYTVTTCADGLLADELLYTETYDLLLLDLNLPNLDGLTILKNLRRENQQLNVIVLSARSSLDDKIEGLDLGANDYMTKPFQFAELEARIRSLLRRKTIQLSTSISHGNLSFDTNTRQVTYDNEPISLTSKETAILEYLLLNKGTVISLETIITHVWDENSDFFSNSVRVHMSSLRRKIKATLGYDPIENRIGQGYIFESAPRERSE